MTDTKPNADEMIDFLDASEIDIETSADGMRRVYRAGASGLLGIAPTARAAITDAMRKEADRAE